MASFPANWFASIFQNFMPQYAEVRYKDIDHFQLTDINPFSLDRVSCLVSSKVINQIHLCMVLLTMARESAGVRIFIPRYKWAGQISMYLGLFFSDMIFWMFLWLLLLWILWSFHLSSKFGTRTSAMPDPKNDLTHMKGLSACFLSLSLVLAAFTSFLYDFYGNWGLVLAHLNNLGLHAHVWSLISCLQCLTKLYVRTLLVTCKIGCLILASCVHTELFRINWNRRDLPLTLSFCCWKYILRPSICNVNCC